MVIAAGTAGLVSVAAVAATISAVNALLVIDTFNEAAVPSGSVIELKLIPANFVLPQDLPLTSAKLSAAKEVSLVFSLNVNTALTYLQRGHTIEAVSITLAPVTLNNLISPKYLMFLK